MGNCADMQKLQYRYFSKITNNSTCGWKILKGVIGDSLVHPGVSNIAMCHQITIEAVRKMYMYM